LVDIIIEYYRKNAEIERVGQFIDRIGFKKFKADVLARFYQTVSAATEPEIKQTETSEKIVPIAGGLTTGSLVIGDAITKDSIIADIVRIYPQTVPVFRSFGMGCLGCPSSAGEPVWRAAEIHGSDLDELVAALNKVI
jgi:hybrid cluster-associated redox disulfide protein